ncbi:MAG: hypothetical protein ACO2OZ_03395 [Acidilobaceae archaeon]
MRVRVMVELGELGKALLEWARIRNRINLLAYDINTEFNKDMSKHVLKAVIIISCDTARDCSKVEDGLTYLLDNFEKLKDKPLTLLTSK